MSIRVPLEELAAEVALRGPGYLVTAGAGERPHVLQLRFEPDGGRLVAPVGRTAAANISAQPSVTLLWPPVADPARPELDGYSLIVDASATVAPDGRAVLDPSGAVFHRPAH